MNRFEMALNSNELGDPRNTTMPKAMVGSMEQMLVKDELSAESRQRWRAGNVTGRAR